MLSNLTSRTQKLASNKQGAELSFIEREEAFATARMRKRAAAQVMRASTM